MKIPLLNLGAEHKKMREELDRAISKVIDDSSFIKGPALKEFEDNFARFCNRKYCVGTNSGTSALYLALKESRIGEGDEVLTVPNTFIATIEAISMTGAKPTFVDVDSRTFLMDVTKIEEKITPKTKAIIPVHLHGKVVDMDPIIKIAQEHNLIIIEDCCQAHGAEYKGRRVPINGLGCFSFFPSKHLGGLGDGGAIVTDNDMIYKRSIKLRDHGREEGEKHYHNLIGFNFRLDSINAAVLEVKLRYLEDNLRKRKDHAKYYEDALRDLVEIPPKVPGSEHTYHLYVILVKERDKLEEFLDSKGIKTGIHYKIPLHLQPAYCYLGYKEGDFPIAEDYAKRTISIPLSPELLNEEKDYVINQIKLFFDYGI